MANEKGVLNNIIWKFAERISAQLVTTVVSIILARLLDPSNYGIISIVTIFITIANVFVSDGFGSALIQKKDADKIDFSSVLWASIILSVAFYLILFFLAPFIPGFFGKGYECLTPVMRVLGLRLIVAAINSVQQAYIAKKMIFKKFFFATLFGTLVSAVVGITMAYMGFGVWALVAQYLTNTTVDTVFLAFSIRKKPILVIKFNRLRMLLTYGWKNLGTNLLITGFNDLRALIVGKVYSSGDLAFYTKGNQFPNLVMGNVSVSFGAVLFPKMSSQQDDLDSLKETTRKSIRFCSYLMMPLMIGLLAVSRPFVSVILTDKWLPCVRMMRGFCIIYMFSPIHSANMQAIKAVGRSDTLLKLEFIKKMIELITLLCFVWISVEAIVMSLAAITIGFTYLNAYPNKKLIGYSFSEQIKDMICPFIMSSFMGVCVYLFGLIPMNNVLSLIFQIVCGAVIYIVISVIFEIREFSYIKRFIFSKFKRR